MDSKNIKIDIKDIEQESNIRKSDIPQSMEFIEDVTKEFIDDELTEYDLF